MPFLKFLYVDALDTDEARATICNILTDGCKDVLDSTWHTWDAFKHAGSWSCSRQTRTKLFQRRSTQTSSSSHKSTNQNKKTTIAKPKPLNPLIIAAINTIIPLIPIVMIVNSISKLSPSLVWSSCLTFIASIRCVLWSWIDDNTTFFVPRSRNQ